jgi:hypothetical protein
VGAGGIDWGRGGGGKRRQMKSLAVRADVEYLIFALAIFPDA